MRVYSIFLFVASFLVSSLFTRAAQLSPDDYCSPSISAPKGVKDMTPLIDGESFAAISDDGKSIEVFSYKTGLKLNDLFSIDQVKGDVKIDSFDGYQISDNGKKILLWNNPQKIYRYSFYAEYYVYDIFRSTLKRVSSKGAQRGAVMSHDGRLVAYMRDNNVFISNLDYDTDYQVTKDGKVNEIINGTPDWSYEEEFGMLNSICWSGDDSTLCFLRFDETEVPMYSFDQYRSYCDQNPLGDLYPEAYSYKYPLAGYPNSSVSVLAYNVDNKTLKTMDLPVEDKYVPGIGFDGCGRNLMVMILNRDQNELNLYKVNPSSTVGHLVFTEKSTAWLSPSAYQMVKYYESNFIIGSERSGYRHLYEYDYNGNLLKQITKGDWNVTDYYGYSGKTNLHYIQTTQNGAVNRNISSVDAKGVVRMLNPKEGTESAMFSRGLNYFVRKYSNVTVPPQYSICNNSGKELKVLEDNKEYAAKYASAPKMELLKVKNDAGQEMDACMIKPVNFDSSKQYPLMMYQYNGPDSQLVLNSWHMDGSFYIASQGYIVAMADGRGTGNRSREWSTSVYCKLGQLETKDQIAAANEFGKLQYVDATRLSCFGWSFGGYMTLMEMSDVSSPFKVGVSMAPVTDWRFYDSIYTERYMLTPQQNESGYNAASALERTQDLKGRLLIMSGTSDDNVHFYNTLKYTSKLNSEGTIFDMMAYAGFEHSLRMCNARTQLYKKIVDFLNKNL